MGLCLSKGISFFSDICLSLSLSLPFSRPPPPPPPPSSPSLLSLPPPALSLVLPPLMFLCLYSHPYLALSSSSLVHVPQVPSPNKPDALTALLPAPPDTGLPQFLSPHPQEPRKPTTGPAMDAEATRPTWAAALPPRLPRGRNSSCAGAQELPS